MTTSLLTDRYELTMLDAALQSGRAHRRSVFEAFGRRLPEGRRFGVVAGTGRLLDLVADFTFSADDLAYLSGFLTPAAVDYLAGKIRSGGSGVWGPVPMPAQTLPEADARTLAQWLKDGAKK